MSISLRTRLRLRLTTSWSYWISGVKNAERAKSGWILHLNNKTLNGVIRDSENKINCFFRDHGQNCKNVRSNVCGIYLIRYQMNKIFGLSVTKVKSFAEGSLLI